MIFCRKKISCRPAFTLMELLLYSAIVGVISVGLVSIFSNVYDYYINVQVKTNISQSLRFAAQTMQLSVSEAVSVSTSTGSILVLGMNTAAKNPTEFGLLNGRIYKKEGYGEAVYISPENLEVTALDFSYLSAYLTEALLPHEWAWSGGGSAAGSGEGIGWIDFSPSASEVKIPIGSGDFYGMAYAPGPDAYISLNCASDNSCGEVQYKVYSDANGTVRGWGWSDLFGWVSFNSLDTTSTVVYGVSVSSSTGVFSGWAWSENIGWVSFNCSNTEIDSCGIVNYRVQANRKQNTPSNTVFVSITMRNLSIVPRFRFTDTYEFAIPISQVSNVTVTSVNPSAVTTTAILTITGTNFQSGAITKLTRAGYEDITPSIECTFVSSASLQSCQYGVSGRQAGLWNVVVLNPDGQVGVLPRGLSVLALPSPPPSPLSPSIPQSVVDSYNDTTKIDNASSFYYRVSGSQLSADYGFGDGHDGEIIISANKNINNDIISAGRTAPDGINFAVTAIGANNATVDADNPVGMYHMDEISDYQCRGDGSDDFYSVCDSSFYSQMHGLNSGTVITPHTGYGYARQFSYGDRIDIEESAVTDFMQTNSFTVEAWVKTSANSGAILSKDDGTGRYPVSLRLNSGKAYFVVNHADTGSVSVTSNNRIDDNIWHHVAAVRDVSMGKLYLYIDGVVQLSTPTDLSGEIANNDNWTIGNGGSGYTQWPFVGTIDEVRLYGYVRTQTQIIGDMAAEGGGGDSGEGLAVGDEVILINMRGDSASSANVGNHEFLIVQSALGNAVTFTTNVFQTYGVGSNSNLAGQKIMLQRVPNYTNVTVNSGYTLTANSWNGTKSGLVIFRSNGTLTVNGTISADALGYGHGLTGASPYQGGGGGESFCSAGGAGGTASNGLSGAAGGGASIYHTGGVGICGGGGGGTVGGTGSVNAGGAGGGGSGGLGGGGGAGYGTFGYGGNQSGTNGGTNVSGNGASITSNAGGGGGGTYGTVNLSKLILGSGGGTAGEIADGRGTTAGLGGFGGGTVFAIGNNINASTGTISSDGADGTKGQCPVDNNGAGSGGGGSGGAVKIIGNAVSLGTGRVIAIGGNGAVKVDCGYAGGNGGFGRIAVGANSVSGTTIPSYVTTTLLHNATATTTSINLLFGVEAYSIDSFVYNLSVKPSGTSATIQFSQNGVTWYNSIGTLNSADTLTTGTDNTIDLTSLGWSGAGFYYRTVFGTNNGASTPVLDDITLNYTIL